MLLVRLPAGDGVSLQWVEPGTGDKVVYHALNSQTFFVSEDEVRVVFFYNKINYTISDVIVLLCCAG